MFSCNVRCCCILSSSISCLGGLH